MNLSHQCVELQPFKNAFLRILSTWFNNLFLGYIDIYTTALFFAFWTLCTTLELNNNKLTFTIELGKAAGWSDYIGNITESFSVQTFGKSAPENDLAVFFKVNADSIGKKIRNYLG